MLANSHDWKCSCGELVFASKNSCRKCGNINPRKRQHPYDSNDWKCKCGEFNFASRKNCRICNAKYSGNFYYTEKNKSILY